MNTDVLMKRLIGMSLIELECLDTKINEMTVDNKYFKCVNNIEDLDKQFSDKSTLITKLKQELDRLKAQHTKLLSTIPALNKEIELIQQQINKEKQDGELVQKK